MQYLVCAFRLYLTLYKGKRLFFISVFSVFFLNRTHHRSLLNLETYKTKDSPLDHFWRHFLGAHSGWRYHFGSVCDAEFISIVIEITASNEFIIRFTGGGTKEAKIGRSRGRVGCPNGQTEWETCRTERGFVPILFVFSHPLLLYYQFQVSSIP